MVVVYPLPWPLLVGGPIFPLVVHQLASPSFWASSAVTPSGSVHKTRGNNVVGMCCLCECYKGGIVVMDVFWGRILCKYDLFVLSWVRVRRVRRGSLSSELLMCGGGVRSMLLLPLVARCLETMDVCIWRMFVFISVVMTVWGSVGMFVLHLFTPSCCGECFYYHL